MRLGAVIARLWVVRWGVWALQNTGVGAWYPWQAGKGSSWALGSKGSMWNGFMPGRWDPGSSLAVSPLTMRPDPSTLALLALLPRS